MGSILGTSTIMSIRSNKGQLILDWYFATSWYEQVHCLVGSLYMPHLHGFIAATTIIRQGYCTVPLAREICTTPSSIGWRKTSNVSRGNSGNSSRNNTPWCAREISPGNKCCHQPIKEILLAVWWIARNWRWVIIGNHECSLPTMEYILETSNDSSWVNGGRILIKAFANIVLPLHGAPINKILCHPAAATINALFAISCPMIWSKVTSCWIHNSLVICSSKTQDFNCSHWTNQSKSSCECLTPYT